jgi:hypothetical protein
MIPTVDTQWLDREEWLLTTDEIPALMAQGVAL